MAWAAQGTAPTAAQQPWTPARKLAMGRNTRDPRPPWALPWPQWLGHGPSWVGRASSNPGTRTAAGAPLPGFAQALPWARVSSRRAWASRTVWDTRPIRPGSTCVLSVGLSSGCIPRPAAQLEFEVVHGDGAPGLQRLAQPGGVPLARLRGEQRLDPAVHWFQHLHEDLLLGR